MSNIAEAASERLKRFKLYSDHMTGHYSRQRKEFLRTLKATHPTYEVFDGTAKRRCLHVDTSGILMATLDDHLVFRQHTLGDQGTVFGAHREVRFLRASERHGVVVTVNKAGKFKLWDYRTKSLLKMVNTVYTNIKEVVIKAQEEVLILNKDDLVLIDFRGDRSVLLVEKAEGAMLPGEDEWRPLVHPVVKPSLEAVAEDKDFKPATSLLDLEVEQQILESGKMYEQMNAAAGKKARRASVHRQTLLHSMHDFRKKTKTRIVYLESSGTLICARDKILTAIDFPRRRYSGSAMLAEAVTCLVTNDESYVFAGMKSGIIKVYDAADLTEQGELVGHTHQITSILNSKGNHRLVFSAAKDDTVRVWHLGLGEEIGQLLQDRAFKEGMEKLEVGGRRISMEFDAALSAKLMQYQRLKGSKNRISDLALSADEEFLYCIFNDEVFRWRILFHYKEFDYVDPNPDLRLGVFGHQRPDNLYAPFDQKIQRIDAPRKSLDMESPPLSDRITCVAVSRAEEVLAVGLANGFVGVLRAKDLSVSYEVEVSVESIENIEFFRENFVVASARDGGLYVFDLSTQRKYHLGHHIHRVTSFFLSQTQEYLFTAGHDLLIRKYDLRPLYAQQTPVEEFSFPIELPAHAMSIDLKRNLLYFSQRDVIHVFDIVGRETVMEIAPPRLSEVQEKLRDRSGANSETGPKLTYTAEETVLEAMSWATREEFAVRAIFQLVEFNLVVIVRANGNVSCWDAGSHDSILDFFLSDRTERTERGERGERVVRAVKPHTGHLFFVFTDRDAVECVNVFRINFFDCCYIQTFSERMSEDDFTKKMRAFFELAADSPFIEKVLHPLYLAFLLNKYHAIGYILKNWGYPVMNSFQTSPLILALEGRHVNFAESLFRELAAFRGPLTFRYLEIKCMMEHDFRFVKRLLIKLCEKVEVYTNSDERIKKYNQLKTPQDTHLSFSGHFTRKTFEGFLVGNIADGPAAVPAPELRRAVTFGSERGALPVIHDSGDDEKESLIRRPSENEIIRLPSQVQSPEVPAPDLHPAPAEPSARAAHPVPDAKKDHKKTFTEVFRVNGFYNFERGSDDTLNFLYRYSQSNVDEFVLSNWRHLIVYKWRAVEGAFRVMALLYFAFLFSLNLLLMHPGHATFTISTAVLLGLLFLFELVPLVAYRQYYFSNATNYLDLALYFLTAGVLVWLHFRPDPLDLRFQALEVLTDCLAFYKGIAYMHIFKSMRSMTFMINNLIAESREVLVMILYLTLALTVLLNVVMYDNGFYGNLVWVVLMSYCNFPADYNQPLIKLFVIVVTMFCLTLIMINFMIAKMANIYQTLETKQAAANLKRMAIALFEFEIWFRIFYRNRSDRKYMTYFVMKAKEPDYVVEDRAEEEEDLAVAGFRERVNLAVEQVERTEMRSKNILELRKDVTKLKAQSRMTNTYQDLQSINDTLGRIAPDLRHKQSL